MNCENKRKLRKSTKYWEDTGNDAIVSFHGTMYRLEKLNGF